MQQQHVTCHSSDSATVLQHPPLVTKRSVLWAIASLISSSRSSSVACSGLLLLRGCELHLAILCSSTAVGPGRVLPLLLLLLLKRKLEGRAYML